MQDDTAPRGGAKGERDSGLQGLSAIGMQRAKEARDRIGREALNDVVEGFALLKLEEVGHENKRAAVGAVGWRRIEGVVGKRFDLGFRILCVELRADGGGKVVGDAADEQHAVIVPGVLEGDGKAAYVGLMDEL